MRFVKVISESAHQTMKKLERNCIACSKAIFNAPHETEKVDKTSNNTNDKLYRRFSFKHITRTVRGGIYTVRNAMNKKTTSAITATVCAISLAILFNANFSFAYNAFLNGTELGFVPDKSYVQNSVDSINAEFAVYVSGENIISGEAVFAPAIIKKNAFTDKTSLEEKIKSTSDIMVKAFSIEVDGRVCSALQTREEAESVLNSILAEFVTGDTTEVYFQNQVSTVNQFVPASAVMKAHDAMSLVSEYTTVISTDTLNYETSVPFDEEVMEDNSMYEGAEKILQKGLNGVNTVTEQIIRVNGEVESRTVLSNISVTPTQTQLRAVGTKERPYYMGTGTFLRPYYGTISSRFGSRRSGSHSGVDFSGRTGDPVVAADTGTVIFSGWSGGYGNIIKIDHHNGYVTYYAHCSSLNAKVGDVVKKGQTIAAVGNTGNSTGPHLHFEIRYNDEVYNPMNYVD